MPALKLIMLALVILLSIGSTTTRSSEQEADIIADMNDSLGVADVVFARNLMEFSGDRNSGGASSSLISIDDKIYVLTAKHLLTDAMGIVPTVRPSNFNAELEDWIVMDNVSMFSGDLFYFAGQVTGMHRPNDDMEMDVMVLATDIDAKEVADNILPVSKDDVSEGDSVYVVGCPYSLEDKCLQIIYAGEVTDVSNEEIYFSWKKEPDQLSGFSGAAVLNGDGAIVAVLFGGTTDRGIATLLPHWLKEQGE